jgi:hypothetical protein
MKRIGKNTSLIKTELFSAKQKCSILKTSFQNKNNLMFSSLQKSVHVLLMCLVQWVNYT